MKRPIIVAACLLAAAGTLRAELKPQTSQAFDRYVALTEARMEQEVSGHAAFMWIDRQPAAVRASLLARLAKGEIVVERLKTLDGGKEIEVDDGMIHHWLGTVLLPKATLDRVMTFVQDYGKYAEHFSPTIQRSTLLRHDGEHFDAAMRTRTHKIITVVIDAEYGIDYRTVSPTRIFTKSLSRNMMEVQNAGQPGEKRVPGDEAYGYLWRLYNYCSFEQREDGVYEQCESVSLTRDVPFGLGWIVRPFITGLPRETLEFTLGRVRTAVTK